MKLDKNNYKLAASRAVAHLVVLMISLLFNSMIFSKVICLIKL